MSEIRHTPVARTMVQVLPPGGGIDAHRHDENQIVYAGRGVLSITTDSGTWIAPETQALWVPAGTVHEHRAYGETELNTIGLPARDNPLGLHTPAVLAVKPLLRELIRAYTEGGSATEPHDPARDDPERRRLRAVLIDQLRHAPRQPVRLPSARDPRLCAVCTLLADDLTDDRTLAALGTQVGAGERTLSRLFRSELGMSFPQWRTQLRLHRALILLAENTPVTTVAHRCGWSSASAFIDVFRTTFGYTPGTLLRPVT
ncbi:MAG TPA: helix-turn-helix transcriptional regulator [Pseudonocardia sp.]|jgi:AraC-like DNA-binding protein|nr:helix-turn-helix transcriptional regulator [Pseudonocardia sp.]